MLLARLTSSNQQQVSFTLDNQGEETPQKTSKVALLLIHFFLVIHLSKNSYEF